MPAFLLALLALAAPARGAEDERLFISPMGEPFRSAEAPEALWFKGVDRDGDGRLTLAEMTADADRFFAVLDADGSGEIDPAEVERYETAIVPEVGMRAGEGRLTHDPARDGPDVFATGVQPQPQGRYTGRRGAGMFSYIDTPQPILSADTNFNRGVSRIEFARAAERRFRLLDADRDGALVAKELPDPPRARSRRKPARRN